MVLGQPLRRLDGHPDPRRSETCERPRIRREVVAQLLDYAASFTSTWNADKLAAAWEKTVLDSNLEPEPAMRSFLADTEFSTADEFWRSVERHVKAGEMRLLIVADAIPAPLARIIEYLNEQMTHTELLGLEIRPRRSEAGEGARSYSVSVVGDTTAAAATKGRPERRTEADFDSVFRTNRGEAELAAVRRILVALQDDGASLSVGTKETNPRLFANYRTDRGDTFWPVAVLPRQGRLVLQLRWLAYRPGFHDESDRREFRDRVAEIVGTPLEGQLNGFPWLPTSALLDDEVSKGVLEQIQWAVDRVRTESAKVDRDHEIDS